MVEVEEVNEHRVLKMVLAAAVGALLLVLYLWIHAGVLGKDLPKTVILRHQNTAWQSRMAVMSGHLDQYEELLELLEIRDDKIYRSVYGMNEIPAEVREAGIGGPDRYAAFDAIDKSSPLRGIAIRTDRLMKMAAVQSKSFDDVQALASTAGDMASCIPAIAPMSTDPTTYRMSSPFGYRSDPITGAPKGHSGMDFACPPGNPVYATGDGVVEAVKHEFFGYGNWIMINHGFGYKSRYAHLSRIFVREGQKVKRGDFIGLSGRSGRATGPHLHYEVFYRDNHVNPAPFMDLTLPPEDYYAIVKVPDEIPEEEPWDYADSLGIVLPTLKINFELPEFEALTDTLPLAPIDLSEEVSMDSPADTLPR